MTSDLDLLRNAQIWGYTMTARQLERWRNEGLMPPLSTRGKGRGRGQARFYEVNPSAQLQELIALRKAGIPISECVVRLWLTGFPIDLADIRRQLPRALKSAHRFRRYLNLPSFAEQYAEYLRRTPRDREPWFGDKVWNQNRHDLILDAAEVLAGKPNTNGRETLRSFAARLTNLSDSEREVIVALGGDPNALMDGIPSTFRLIFQRLEQATDAELLKARELQRSMVELAEVSNRIAAIMPNPISSLLARVSQPDDIDSSYGLFVGFGMLVLADGGDILSNMRHMLDQLRQVLNNLVGRKCDVAPGSAA